jgi:hypothetical protein
MALLIAPWPGLDEAYAKMVRASGERLFGRFGAKGIVVFRPADEGPDSLHDTKIFWAIATCFSRAGSWTRPP